MKQEVKSQNCGLDKMQSGGSTLQQFIGKFLNKENNQNWTKFEKNSDKIRSNNSTR